MLAEPSRHANAPIPFSSLSHLLEYQAKRNPDAPAILAPGRAPLSYGLLFRHAENMRSRLRAMGISRHDRVAVVLPNGPDLAEAIVATAASAACAPLNPAYGAEELDRYFAALRPSVLITEPLIDQPARRVALARGIPVVELSTSEYHEDAPHESVSAGDQALLLLTSGTTSGAKIVPLTHANIYAAAYSSGAAVALRDTDRCVNMLPLFHVHGLIATLLASLAAGASVVCTAGCDVDSFFAWLMEFRPTWYSAVPAMHQAILARARHNRARAAACRLRLIRSGSAPLPPRIFRELEEVFATSVVEFYGMTEAASGPIACNPLPPGERKAGSVGLPVGLPVAIMDEGGELLPGGQTGQIVIRGASVMSSYDGDPSATQAAFAGDWFKTGDQGFFDDDGYLYLVGRSREIINRGGEKVTPREVDDVLLEHPAVAEAITFAVPHATLGEDVAAAVVLRPHMAATPKDIRQFALGRVADFKVPRQVLIVAEIPKGPTGKVLRVGLAAKLGLAGSKALPRAFIAPRTQLEKVLAEIWADILQVERVGIHDDFFALGGDSLLVTHAITRVYDLMHLEIDLSRFFAAPTVAEMAEHLETLRQAGAARRSSSAISGDPRQAVAPASVTQEMLWQLQRALAGMPFFNILYALRVTSPCDVAVLERSINEIVRRHNILRTSFAVVDGRQIQVIAPHLTVPLIVDDLRVLPQSKKQVIGHQLVQEEALYAFELARGPLLRVRLVSLAEREHFFLINMHQIIGDGWSLGVLVEELAALYDAFSAGEASPVEPLSIQYADFAQWQRNWQSHPDVVAQLAYWREQLRDPLPAMDLAQARSRRTIDGLRTARREVALPASLSEAAKRFGRQENGTLFMVLAGALKTLLYCYLGEEDVRVATAVANRHRPETERLIGPLSNTVILRTNLGGDPNPREVMRRVRATTLAAFAHQDLPFEELAGTLERERGLDAARLSQIMIVLQNATLRPMPSSRHALAFAEADPSALLPLVTATTSDVTLMLHEAADGLVGTCVYKPYLFGATAIDRLLRDFRQILEYIVTQPDRPISAIRISLRKQPSKP